MSNERLPPLVFRFVSGTSSTAQKRSVVRSHAMTEYRRRQRQDWLLSTATTRHKQRISAKSKSKDEDNICVCLQPPSQPMEVFCLRCGRERPINFNSIFFESHEHGLALQILSPSLIADLGQGEFDPFHSMPGLSYSLKEDQIAEINIVKAYALTFCLPNPIKSVVFPEMVNNPALCMAVLYMAYSFLASVRGWFDHTVALTMKQASITYVNKTLTSHAT
ncbi:hypothetical protein V1520DRAFT_263535, partial [Lipomyces starkeyi]